MLLFGNAAFRHGPRALPRGGILFLKNVFIAKDEAVDLFFPFLSIRSKVAAVRNPTCWNSNAKLASLGRVLSKNSIQLEMY